MSYLQNRKSVKGSLALTENIPMLKLASLFGVKIKKNAQDFLKEIFPSPLPYKCLIKLGWRLSHSVFIRDEDRLTLVAGIEPSFMEWIKFSLI
jgi:hypothetical protein